MTITLNQLLIYALAGFAFCVGAVCAMLLANLFMYIFDSLLDVIDDKLSAWIDKIERKRRAKT